jgi:hypothetical protein
MGRKRVLYRVLGKRTNSPSARNLIGVRLQQSDRLARHEEER